MSTAWAQHDTQASLAEQPQRVITGPNRVDSETTVTVKTGFIFGFNTTPSFCLFDTNCKTPTTPLAIEYQDAPDLKSALQQALLEKYFYKALDPASQDSTKRQQQVNVKTVYFGTADGYRNLLAKNNRDTAERDAKNSAADLVSLASYILTKGASQPQGQVPVYNTISDKEVATLPAGPEKILVTQVEFKRNPMGSPVAVHETLTAVYADMDEQQLRKINFEDGVKRVLRLVQ